MKTKVLLFALLLCVVNVSFGAVDTITSIINEKNNYEVTLGITCTSSANAMVASGGQLNFKANLSSVLSNSVYQWLRNGKNVGTNSPNYTATNVQLSEHIQVSVTSPSITDPSGKILSVVIETTQPDPLLGLSLSRGALSPAFTSEETSYTTVVPSNFNKISISAFTTFASLVVVNGNRWVNNFEQDIALVAGTNVVVIDVQTQDGEREWVTYDRDGYPDFHYEPIYQTIRYTLTILRSAPSTEDLTLKSLTVNKGTLLNSRGTGFESGEFLYTLGLDGRENGLTFTPTLNSSTASLKVDGVVASSGSTSQVFEVAEGQIKRFTIVITGADGTIATYIIKVYREPNSYLESISLTSPVTVVTGPTNNGKDYAAVVPMNSTAVVVTATAESNSAFATIYINNVPVKSTKKTVTLNVPLNSAKTIIKIDVKSREYILTIVRGGADNTSLSSISLSPASSLLPIKGGADVNYATAVSPNTNSISIKPTAANIDALITVNGASAVSGSFSRAIPLNQTGSTIIPIVVKSFDGTKQTKYSIKVDKADAGSTALNSIVSNPASDLIVATGSADQNYDLVVPATTSSIQFTATAAVIGATIHINGVTVQSGSTSNPILLGDNNSNTINISVTSGNGLNTSTYVVNVIRSGLHNANLADLDVSNGVLNPKFSATVYGYTDTVTATISSIKVIPTAQSAGSIIKVNGEAVTSGDESLALPLSDGINIIDIKVYSAGGDSLSYTISVYRRASTDVKNISINPSTNIIKTSGEMYTATLPYNVTSVAATVTAESADAIIYINNKVVPQNFYSLPITLKEYETVIPISIIDNVNKIQKNYTLTVYRQGSTNNLLSAIKVNPASTPVKVNGTAKRNFLVSVAPGTNVATITPTSENPLAQITVNNVLTPSGAASVPINLPSDTTVVPMLVVAANGISSATYNVIIVKSGSSNTSLNAIRLNPASTPINVKGPANRNYTLSVAPNTASAMLTVVAQDELQTIAINGTEARSEVPFGPIALTGQTTVVGMTVTAPDGVTISSYALTITKAGSTNANLITLSANNASLSPKFNPNVTYYSGTTSSAATTVNLRAIKADATATVLINGVAVTSSNFNEVRNLPLRGGKNIFYAVVTSGNGTVKTYTYEITRPGAVAFAATTLKQKGLTFEIPAESTAVAANDILVRQAVSPNADGVNDQLIIDGLQKYPENTLQIMNSTGALIFEAKNYGTSAKVFDGHASNGKLQPAGTYFYMLEYVDDKQIRRKTGYLVLKY